MVDFKAILKLSIGFFQTFSSGEHLFILTKEILFISGGFEAAHPTPGFQFFQALLHSFIGFESDLKTAEQLDYKRQNKKARLELAPGML